MDLFSSIAISASGLSAQRLRMDLISSNLANIYTTRTPEGGPYRRKQLVLTAVPAVKSFESVFQSQLNGHLRKVKVLGISEANGKPRMLYDPYHPDANEQGYVAMPDINLVEEMVNMLMATRFYEANVEAINAAKNMALEALKIGR